MVSRIRRAFGAAFAGVVWLACSNDPAAPEIPTGNPNGKDDGGDCAKGFDCKSGVCNASKCAVATGFDHVKNGKETGLDCGGPDATPCGGGQDCNVPDDCASGDCEAGSCTGPATPPTPTATDGKRNGDESDVDCGGGSTQAPRCAPNKNCRVTGDCDSKVCSGNKCAAPTSNDKVENGDESDVDCGGKLTGAPRCVAGAKCVEDADCASNGCDDTMHCAIGRSCTKTDGGSTCGAGEVGDPKAQHESCCLALPVPGGTALLDKYKVTAGRMRAFIEHTQGDVMGWYAAAKPTLPPAAVAQIDPYAANLPGDLDDAANHLGGYIFLTDRPSPEQGCFTGSAANPAYGAHTYFTAPDPGLDPADQEDRAFDQKFLDRLPLNCVTYPLMAAFCAWDGGRLQTFEENDAAFGPHIYPWGDTPVAGGYVETPADSGNLVLSGPAGVTPAVGIAACPTCDPTLLNWSYNYQFPEGGDPNKPWDYAFYISAPGRFPMDKGPGGHMDIGGDMMELTGSPAIAIGGDATEITDPEYGAKIRWARAGSWEGHQTNNPNFQFAIMTKYGKTGGRCAHDP